MADFVFNVAKGRVAHYTDDAGVGDAALVVVLLKSTGIDGDATMMDLDTLSAVLSGSDEADFTNYARKEITTTTVTVDDGNDRVDSDFADQTWSSAGGTTDNTLGKLLVCYDPDTTVGTDADIVPLTAHDFSATTDGSDLTAQLASAGFHRAA